MIFVTALFLASMLLLLTNSSEAQLQPRIVGGTDAPSGRYPYFTLLEITMDTPGGIFTFQCGGTLALHRDVVLTAAHCLDEQQDGFGPIVRILAIIDPSQRHIVRRVTAHTLNSNYVRAGQRNNLVESDLAFVRLSEPVDTIEPVQVNLDTNLPSDGQSVRVMGFGVLAFSDNRLSETLRVATVQIVNHDQCRAAGGAYNLIRNFFHLCAAAPGRDSCQGDSGGPLIIPSTNEDPSGDIQVGIASFGFRCADPNFPGFYTRVSSFAHDLTVGSCFFSHTSACSDFFFGMMSQSRSGRTMKMGGSMGMTRVSMGMKVSMGSMTVGVTRASMGMMGRPRKSGMMAMKVSMGTMMMGISRVSVRTKRVMRRPRKSGMMGTRSMAMGMGQSSSGMKGMRFSSGMMMIRLSMSG